MRIVSVFLLFLISTGMIFSQGTSINVTGAPADSSAILDISSSDQGVLVPRMTITERNQIVSPALSLLIFNTTDSVFNYWNGMQWLELGDASAIVGNQAVHYVGELFGGGIVFYVDETGQHGLIASLDDLDGGNGIAWSTVINVQIGQSAADHYDGVNNIAGIMNQSGHTNSAAKLCDDYTYGSYSDWYLPSIIELRQLEDALLIIYNVLENDGLSTTNAISALNEAPTYGKYWSSTEWSSGNAWGYRVGMGYSNGYLKSNTNRVRAVRKF